jgi:hypothetical protein
LDETAARFEAEPYPAFDELQVFSTFKWMMDETQKKQLTTWVGAIFASGTKDSDTIKGKATKGTTSGGTPAGTKRVVKASKDSVRANTARRLQYF